MNIHTIARRLKYSDVVIAGFLVQAVCIGVWYSYGIFVTPLSNEFGWSRATISGAASVANIVIGLFAVFIGILSDRIGPKIVMTVCGVVLASSYFLMSTIHSALQLYLFYGLVLGIGWSATDVITLSTVAKRFRSNIGSLTGIVKVGGGVGMFLMPLLLGSLISNHGWRFAFFISGIIVLAVIPIVAQFLKNKPININKTDPETDVLPRPG